MTLLFSSVFSWAAADCPLDSILTFDIDSVLTEVTVFAYDDAGHTTSEVVWIVNADGSRVGKSKKEDLYEGDTQVMTSTYVWNNTTSKWEGVAKTEYEYTNGKMTATTVFDWPDDKWSAKSKETYAYDADGRETEYTTYARNASGQLDYVKQRKKTYNTAGKLILDIQSNYTNGTWVGSFKYVYDYNASGTQILYEYYSSFTNGAWVGSTKWYYEFDAAGNKTLEENYSGMTGGVWKGSSKYTATFNTNKKETEHIAFKWVTSTKKWQENTRTTKEYDGNNVTDDASYTWSNKWVGKTRTSKTYSGSLVTSEIEWKWSNNRWEHNKKTETQYAGSNISVQTKSVWKNSGWVNVSQLTNTYVSNRLTEANTKAWRNGEWQDSVRTVNTYNAKNINTLSVTAAYKGSEWISMDSTTREVTYTTIGSKDYVVEDVSMKWTAASNKWTGVKRETKEYDTSGNVIQADTYTFVVGKGWVHNMRNLSEYKDGNSNLPTLNATMIWDKTNEEWIGTSKTEKKYDETNRLVKTSTYSWSTTRNDWEGLSSSEDIYVNNIKVTSCTYTWDYDDWQWKGLFKHDYTYSGNKLIEQIDWRYNKTTGWYYDTRVTYTFDNKGRTIQTIKYQWVAAKEDWCMTSTSQTTYDADADGGKLREQLTATGSNCAVTTYALQHYMYGCDLRYYTIRFVNDDGTLLAAAKWAKGETPNYSGDEPTKASSDEWTYTFAGWDNEVVAVIGDATYTATYTAIKRSYTITWLNDDNTEIDQTTVEYGVVPEHAEPTKARTDECTFTFAGWDNEVVAVTGDATYKATFTASKNSYTITWLNDDNTVIDQTTVEYGVVPEHAEPTKASSAEWTYSFAGWDNEVVAVTGDATYKATFTASKNSYTITWLNDDNTVIDQTTVEYGVVPEHADPTKTATAQYTYTFAGWSPEITSVTGNATYTATFSSTVNTYTVIWLNEDGSELSRETLEYGAEPIYHGTEPTKEPDGEYIYTFDGWTPNVEPVTGDATYTATFTAISCGDYPLLPVVDLYNWLLMLDVRSARAMGYVFSEEDVTWYRVQGEPDKMSDGVAADDVRVGAGFSFTINESLANTGDYYAMVDVSSSSTGVPCTGMVRSNMIHCATSSDVFAPALAPTLLRPGEPQQVIGLNPDAPTVIAVYDISGRLLRTVANEGIDRLEMNAETVPGCYQISVQNGDQRTILRYVVVQ